MAGLRYLRNVTTLRLDPEKCTGCGMCVAVCPHAVFRLDDQPVLIVDRDACMECGACARNCPTAALSVAAGVGCAAAVIRGALQGPGADCGCAESNPCCGS
jgi:ferredoxin